MFYVLHTTWQLIILLAGLGVFAAISWHWPKLAVWLIIFGSPLYLLKISFWPVTVFEAMIWVFAIIWLVSKTGPPRDCIRDFSLPRTSGDGFGRRFLEAGGRSFGLALFLILAGVFLAVVSSADWRVGLGAFKSYFVAPLIFSFILVKTFNGKELYRLVFFALFASSAAAAAIALVYLLSGRLTFDGRLTAFYLSPNHLAMFLAPGLIFGFGLWLEAKTNRRKFLLLAVYILLFLAIYFTFSYGAWLGLAGAAIFILCCFGKYKITGRRQLLIACCFLAVLLAAALFLQLRDGHSDKLVSLLTSSRSSWQSRIMVWRSAVEILKDYWLPGIGPGLFQKYYLEYQQYFSVPYLEWAVPQPHNLFLSWWLQAGLAGFVGLVLLLIIFFGRTVAAVKRYCAVFDRPEPEEGRPAGFLAAIKPPLIIILMAVMVYFLIHGLADTTFWKSDLALIFWLMAFLGCIAGRRAC